MKAGVELTIRYGEFGQTEKRVSVPLDEHTLRELMGRVELSSDPFSLALASPCLFTGRGADAVTIRRNAFRMRREIAEKIARGLVEAMVEAFGENDELDGYKVSAMSPEEREYHRERGRLP